MHPAASTTQFAPRSIAIPQIFILVFAQALIIAWLFRANLANGFSTVLGDVYDNSIEISILEHWYNVLRGLAHWSSTNYFYPYTGTLGYNDGYWFYGVLYSVFRALGTDPFLSNVFVNMAMKTFGFFSSFLLCRLVFRLDFRYALVTATLFEIGNNITIHTLHAQLLSVAFAPLCGMLLYFAVRSFLANEPRRVLLHGAAFSVVYGIWTMTSFYMLWFFSFFTVIVMLILWPMNHKMLRQHILNLDRRMLIALAASLAVFILALVPFLMVYLPKARETGMHSYADAVAYALSPFDAMNIGAGNYLYGRIIPALHASIGFPLDFTENQMGMPPGLWLSFATGCALAWRRRHIQGREQLLFATALATALILALTIKVDGHTAWHFIYQFFPGAKAIRVVARYLIFLTLPVICIAMVAASSVRFKAAGALSLAWCIFLIAEELNMTSGIAMDRSMEMEKLNSVPRPPAYCKAFFVEDPRPLAPGQGDVDLIYRHNVDAMLIAEYINLPTINGFSSFNPPDWSFDHPERPDYIDRVLHYKEKQGVTALCALNLQTRQWADSAY